MIEVEINHAAITVDGNSGDIVSEIVTTKVTPIREAHRKGGKGTVGKPPGRRAQRRR